MENRIEIEEGADVDRCLRGVTQRDNTRLPRVILHGTRRTRLDLSTRQNGFYEGTPHGSVELARSELMFYSCYCCCLYLHLVVSTTYVHILWLEVLRPVEAENLLQPMREPTRNP